MDIEADEPEDERKQLADDRINDDIDKESDAEDVHNAADNAFFVVLLGTLLEAAAVVEYLFAAVCLKAKGIWIIFFFAPIPEFFIISRVLGGTVIVFDYVHALMMLSFCGITHMTASFPAGSLTGCNIP